jgi:hypothetical protein
MRFEATAAKPGSERASAGQTDNLETERDVEVPGPSGTARKKGARTIQIRSRSAEMEGALWSEMECRFASAESVARVGPRHPEVPLAATVPTLAASEPVRRDRPSRSAGGRGGHSTSVSSIPGADSWMPSTTPGSTGVAWAMRTTTSGFHSAGATVAATATIQSSINVQRMERPPQSGSLTGEGIVLCPGKHDKIRFAEFLRNGRGAATTTGAAPHIITRTGERLTSPASDPSR